MTIDSKFLSLSTSEDGTKLFGKILVCPLDEGNLNKKGIKSDDLTEEELKTLIEQPAVCKVIKDSLGELNLSGHEMKKVKEYNSLTKKMETKVYFDTNPIGFFNTSEIEEIEIDSITKKCIVANVTFWTRYSNAVSVLTKLFDEGNLHVSYELTFSDSYIENDVTWLKGICFFGVAILGSGVQSAYPVASVIELSELDNVDLELAEAFTQDLINELNNNDIQTSIPNEEVNNINNLELSETKNQGGKIMDKNNNVLASLTDNDLYTKVRQAINNANPNDWYYISYLFPYEYRAIAHKWEDSDTEFVEFKYTVNSDDSISITSQTKAEMQFVLKATIDTMLSEKDTKITELTTTISEKETELSAKIEAITKLGEDLTAKDTLIAELTPFKEKVEAAELVEKEAEIAQKKADLKVLATKGGYITTDEVETSEEIKTLVDALDEKSIKAIIAERVIAKVEASELEKKNEVAEVKEVEVSEVKTKVVKTNINTTKDESSISTLSAMDKFLSK
jgi:hypothetical protein